MSRIVVCTMLSLDGCTEGRGGDLMAMPFDDAFNEFIADRARAAGHLLFGATTYRGMPGYWPKQVDNPDATPPDRYLASRYAGDLLVTVVSDSLTRRDMDPVTPPARRPSQPTARRTSSAMVCAAASVSSVTAKDVAHRPASSSSLASGVNPNVE